MTEQLSIDALEERPPVVGPPLLGRPRPGAELAVFLLAVGIFAALPSLGGAHIVGLVGRFLIFGLVAMSLDLLWGYTGQLSFGHAAFFGLGAYATGLTLSHLDLPGVGLLAVVLGVAVPGTLAFLLGVLLFYGRVGGVYFAIVTLLVSLLLEQLAITWIGFTGGTNGLFVVEPLELGPLTVRGLTPPYYLVVAVCGASFLFAWWLVRTPFGRVMQAIKVNEARTASLGHPTAAQKTAVFTLSCSLAGLAGVLYVPLERFVYPTQLGLLSSTEVIVWLAIGGRGTLVGGFLGALGVSSIRSFLSGQLVGYWVLATGVLLVLVVLVWPRGLVGGIVDAGRLARRLARRRADA